MSSAGSFLIWGVNFGVWCEGKVEVRLAGMWTWVGASVLCFKGHSFPGGKVGRALPCWLAGTTR